MDRRLRRFRGSWRLTTVGVLTAGLFLAYLIALPSHLVHHLFDEDHGRLTCPLLSTSQHTPEIQTDPPHLPPPIQIATVQVLSPGVSLPPSDLALSRPRAPPHCTPSV